MSTDFTESIKQWVAIDNHIKKHNDKLRELRAQRGDIQDTILEYVDTNSLSNSTVRISDGKLRFSQSRQTAPLTLRHIEDCLHKCIDSNEDVKAIMHYIKKSRESKVYPDIKRSYTEQKK